MAKIPAAMTDSLVSLHKSNVGVIWDALLLMCGLIS